MDGSLAIASLNELYFRRVQLQALARVGENDLVLMKKQFGIETRRNFGRNFWIAIHCRGHSVGGPTLKKRFARGDPRVDVDLYYANSVVDPAPAGWPELAEGVVLCGDALKIKQ